MINIQKPIDKKRKQIEEQIFYNFMQVVQQFPQYTISQHLCHILRKKEDSEESYHWNNDKLLKKIEDYKDELDRELTLGEEDASNA